MSKSKTAIKNKKQTIEKDPQVPQIWAFAGKHFKILANSVQGDKRQNKNFNRIGKY